MYSSNDQSSKYRSMTPANRKLRGEEDATTRLITV
jgi:hypothetical protein